MSNSLISPTHSSVISGKDLALGVLHQHLEGDFVAGALAEALGQRVVELEDVARALPPQLVVELVHDDPRTDLVEESVAVRPSIDSSWT